MDVHLAPVGADLVRARCRCGSHDRSRVRRRADARDRRHELDGCRSTRIASGGSAEAGAAGGRRAQAQQRAARHGGEEPRAQRPGGPQRRVPRRRRRATCCYEMKLSSTTLRRHPRRTRSSTTRRAAAASSTATTTAPSSPWPALRDRDRRGRTGAESVLTITGPEGAVVDQDAPARGGVRRRPAGGAPRRAPARRRPRPSRRHRRPRRSCPPVEALAQLTAMHEAGLVTDEELRGEAGGDPRPAPPALGPGSALVGVGAPGGLRLGGRPSRRPGPGARRSGHVASSAFSASSVSSRSRHARPAAEGRALRAPPRASTGCGSPCVPSGEVDRARLAASCGQRPRSTTSIGRLLGRRVGWAPARRTPPSAPPARPATSVAGRWRRSGRGLGASSAARPSAAAGAVAVAAVLRRRLLEHLGQRRRPPTTTPFAKPTTRLVGLDRVLRHPDGVGRDGSRARLR